MSTLEPWLHPLRAYPEGFVLASFALSAGGLCWFAAKALKWSVYGMATVAFVALNAVFALWLWA